MFPDMTREDVFRLETRHLWLRWPLEADAEVDGRAALPEAASGDPYAAGFGSSSAIADRLRQNSAGTSLHLVMTGRGADRRPIGRMALRPIRLRIADCGLRLQVWVAEPHRGAGLATEAAQAVVDIAFMLTDAPLVAASARVLDPAFRRVLEKCGFAYCGNGLDPAPAGDSLAASDRFRLDRKAWVSLKAWRVPGMVRERTSPEAPACA